MNTTYQTLIVKFSEPITALDGIFDEAQAWGTNTLKGWIDATITEKVRTCFGQNL